MKFTFSKIHHLIRYFLVLGILGFIGYIRQINDAIFFHIIGPPLYIAYSFKSFVQKSVYSVPNTEVINTYVFLLPVCLIYFGFIGFQMKQLWNERGKIRLLIMAAFIGFLIYIHHFSAKSLGIYLTNG